EIVFSGGNLTRDEFEQMLWWQVATLNLDSLDQLRSLIDVYRNWPEKKYLPRLGFRLNLPDLTGKTRTGVSPAEFPAALELTKGSELQVTGLHFYRGTGTNSTSSFTSVIAEVLKAGQQLPAWNYLDFGGGFGYAYHADRPGFEWKTFGDELTCQLLELSQPVNLVIEPGRAAIARCGTLLTRVVSAKWQEDRQIVGTDTTVGNIAVLAVHGGHREVSFWKDSSSPRFSTDVCGNSTFSRDYLSRDAQLPELKAGDVLGILDVGAYGYAMSSHFLHRPRPAEVLVGQGSPRLIREREGYEVLLAGQVMGEIVKS
ncbi:MAG TPA: decarboxylase, partial [Acidobacteriota bacterium]|nr:decarboxylase [Acidobacteriota bacterium]